MAFKGEYRRNENIFPPFKRVPGKYSPSVKQHKLPSKKLSSPRSSLESDEWVETSDESEIETLRQADNSDKEFVRNPCFELGSPILSKNSIKRKRCEPFIAGGETTLPEIYWPPNSQENLLSDDSDWKTVSFKTVLCSTPVLPSKLVEKPYFPNTESPIYVPVVSTSLVPENSTLKNAPMHGDIYPILPKISAISKDPVPNTTSQAPAVKPLQPCLPTDIRKTSDVEADQVRVPMEIDLFIHTQNVSNQIIALSKIQEAALVVIANDTTLVQRPIYNEILNENSTAGQKIVLENISLPQKSDDNKCLHKNPDYKYSPNGDALHTEVSNENFQQENNLIKNSLQEKSPNQNSQQEPITENSLQEEYSNDNSILEKSTSGESLHKQSLNNDNSLLDDSIHLKSTNCAKSSDVVQGSQPPPELREKPTTLKTSSQELTTIRRIAKPKVKIHSKIPECNLANLPCLRKGPGFFLGDKVQLKGSFIEKISNCKLHDLPLVKRTI